MPDFVILGSGSKANAYFFRHQDWGFLIDNGFSLREILRRLESVNIDPSIIKLIFLTHTHSDHFRGIKSFSSRFQVPVVHHHQLFPKEGLFHRHIRIKANKPYDFKGMIIQGFPIFHDADFPLNYHFTANNQVFTLITDTGQVNRAMMKMAAASDFLFLESNYCPQMLANGTYPTFVKDRIASGHGHLSNKQTLQILNILGKMPNKLKKIFLCHLSENNNQPELVEQILAERNCPSLSLRICLRNELVCEYIDNININN